MALRYDKILTFQLEFRSSQNRIETHITVVWGWFLALDGLVVLNKAIFRKSWKSQISVYKYLKTQKLSFWQVRARAVKYFQVWKILWKEIYICTSSTTNFRSEKQSQRCGWPPQKSIFPTFEIMGKSDFINVLLRNHWKKWKI